MIQIQGKRIKIENESSEPKKIKKNMPICKLKPTVENDMGEDEAKIRKFRIEDFKTEEIKTSEPDLSKIKLDQSKLLSEETRNEFKKINREFAEVFGNDLPGYNNKFGIGGNLKYSTLIYLV